PADVFPRDSAGGPAGPGGADHLYLSGGVERLHVPAHCYQCAPGAIHAASRTRHFARRAGREPAVERHSRRLADHHPADGYRVRLLPALLYRRYQLQWHQGLIREPGNRDRPQPRLASVVGRLGAVPVAERRLVPVAANRRRRSARHGSPLRHGGRKSRRRLLGAARRLDCLSPLLLARLALGIAQPGASDRSCLQLRRLLGHPRPELGAAALAVGADPLRLVWPEPLLLALLARPGRQEPADDLCECRPLLPAKSHCRPDLDRAEPRSDAGEYHPHAAVYAGPCLLARQYGDGRRAAVLGAEAVTLVARPPLLPILPDRKSTR